jgi:hypothetical protein
VNGVPGIVEGALAFAGSHRELVVPAAYAAAGAVAGRAFLPRWSARLARGGLDDGVPSGLKAYRVVPHESAAASPARTAAALEAVRLDPFDGLYLMYAIGRKVDFVVAGRGGVGGAVDSLAAEYATEANVEPVEDLQGILHGVPIGAPAGGPEGLVPVFGRYALGGGALRGFGTIPVPEKPSAAEALLDGALSRVVRAVDADSGEAAVLQVHLRPATEASERALKRWRDRHLKRPVAPSDPGLFVRLWEMGVMQFGPERGRDKVERRDRRRLAKAADAREAEAKETDASRHVDRRLVPSARYDVAFHAFGYAADAGRAEGLKEAFDAFFKRFSQGSEHERTEILPVPEGRGPCGNLLAAELRLPPPRRGRGEEHPSATPQEVAAPFHPLGAGAAVPRKRVAAFLTAPPPPEMDGDGICVGLSNDGESKGLPIRVSLDVIDTHGDLTGKTGKGKSSLQLEFITGCVGWPFVREPDRKGADGGYWRPSALLKERAARAVAQGVARDLAEGVRRCVEDEKNGLMLFDPKGGELFTKVISCLPRWRLKDAWVVDPGSEEYPVAKINFFDPFDHMEPDDQAATIVGALEARFPSGFGANMRPIFVHAALACIGANLKLKLAGHEPKFGLLDLTEAGFLAPRVELAEGLYEQPPIRAEVLSHLRGDPDWAEVVRYWDGKDASQGAREQAKEWNPITNKIAHFKNRKVARFIGGGRSDIDLMAAMEEGRILLFNLSQGSLPADTHELVGTLILNLLCRTAAIRHDRAVRRAAAEDLRRLVVVIDEAQNFACPEMTKTLTEGRSQKTPLWLAHQYVDQFDDKKLLGALANVGTRVHFGTTPDDAKRVAAFVPDPRFTPAVLEGIPKHNCVMVLEDGGGTCVMTAETLPMPPTNLPYVRAVCEGSARALAEKAAPGSVAALEAALMIEAADEAAAGAEGDGAPAPESPREEAGRAEAGAAGEQGGAPGAVPRTRRGEGEGKAAHAKKKESLMPGGDPVEPETGADGRAAPRPDDGNPRPGGRADRRPEMPPGYEEGMP